MNAVVKLFIMLALFTSSAESGPLGYFFWQMMCDAAWLACEAANPAAIAACNFFFTVCMGGAAPAAAAAPF